MDPENQTPLPSREAVSRLAILVVYFLKDDGDLPLLALHLDRIEMHTKVPYTLYAVANRVSKSALAMIGERPNVKILKPPTTALRASREHGYYLDAMIPVALADGVSHICTLDVDSFPIRDSWVNVLLHAAPEESGLSGVLRSENGDVALPHPSCVLARRDFFERFMPSFSPDSDSTPGFRTFLHSTGQSADTGIRLGYILWHNKMPWGYLVRTNTRNPHYLMAGIYGGVVFHLGSASRGNVFRKDFDNSVMHRASAPIERAHTIGPRSQGLQRALLRIARRDVEERVITRNRETFHLLREQLVLDPDALIAYLEGSGPLAASPELASIDSRESRA
jgi:hypothetical protein